MGEKLDYEIRVRNEGENYWIVLVGGNGQVVATGETLTRAESAREIARNVASGNVWYEKPTWLAEREAEPEPEPEVNEEPVVPKVKAKRVRKKPR